MSISQRLMELWDKFAGIDQVDRGEVWRVGENEGIVKYFKKVPYRLVAYSRWQTPAKRWASRIKAETGKDVKLHWVEDKRVHGGDLLNYGIWVEETTEKEKPESKVRLVKTKRGVARKRKKRKSPPLSLKGVR